MVNFVSFYARTSPYFTSDVHAGHDAGSDIILDGSESTDEDRITDLPLRCTTVSPSFAI